MGYTGSLELTGLQVNALTVIERTEERRGTSVMWRCRCSCGNVIIVRAHLLRAGNIRSCGCQTKEILRAAQSTHGLSKTEARTFRVWRNMRARCEKPYHKSFKNYGGRGISVCARWQNFAAFFQDMGRAPEGLTLDRIETNGNYEPSNCRWATAKVQSNNRRNNHIIEHDGQHLTVQQWADRVGISRDTFARRLMLGWDMCRALSEPVRVIKNSRALRELAA